MTIKMGGDKAAGSLMGKSVSPSEISHTYADLECATCTCCRDASVPVAKDPS